MIAQRRQSQLLRVYLENDLEIFPVQRTLFHNRQNPTQGDQPFLLDSVHRDLEKKICVIRIENP